MIVTLNILVELNTMIIFLITNNQTVLMMTFLIYSLWRNAIGTEAVVALSVAMETMSNLQFLK